MSLGKRWGVYEYYHWPGIEGLRVGRTRLALNTSFVVYRVGSTWIDAGPANQWSKVRAFAEDGPPTLLLLTHHHEDHSGNAGHLKDSWRCRVLAPEIGREWLRSGFEVQPYRRLAWGQPSRVETDPLPAKLVDDAGLNWEVIPSPGHADDMVCFFLPERGWLFSADLYVASKVKYGRPEDRLGLEIKSIQRVLELDFDTLFCAHRGRVGNAREALKAKLCYFTTLREKALELYQAGLPFREIQHRLLGREDGAGWVSNFHFCKAHLISACIKSMLEEKAELPPAVAELLRGVRKEPGNSDV